MTALGMAGRVAVRDLVDAYAQGVDRRDSSGVAGLFTEDGLLVVPRPPDQLSPVLERRGREAIERALQGLDRFVATMHAVVAHSVAMDGERATGETSCMAHHVRREPAGAVDEMWAIRYQDAYVHEGGRWLFASRHLWIDWIAEHPVLAVRQEP